METGGKYYEVYVRNVGASASSKMTSIRLSGNDQVYFLFFFCELVQIYLQVRASAETCSKSRYQVLYLYLCIYQV